MRLLLVTESFAPSADPAADTARHLCDALIADGHRVLVLTTTPGKGSYRGARVVRARRVPSAASLRTTAADFGADAVHVLRPRALGAAVVRAFDGTGLPTTVVDPTPFTPRVGAGGRVLASTRAGARLLGMVGVPAQVWRPGVRTDEHHPGLRSPALHDHWARASSPAGPHLVVGYAGPVGASTTKHVRRLAGIAALDGVRLVVLGAGPGTAALKQAGARVAGACGGLELARGLASLDVFVQPRKHDAGLGVVRKALASGVPVVAFDTAAVAEVVVDAHNGLLVPAARGRAGLAEAVTLLAGDPELRAALAGRARESVLGRTWADAAADLAGRPLAPAV